MSKDPWTDPDPQPGDFDADLAAIDACDIEACEGKPDATLTLVVGIEGDDVHLLQELALARGQRPSDVIASLLRQA